MSSAIALVAEAAPAKPAPFGNGPLPAAELLPYAALYSAAIVFHSGGPSGATLKKQLWLSSPWRALSLQARKAWEREKAVCVRAYESDEVGNLDVSQRVIDTVIALLVAPHGLTDLWALPFSTMMVSYAAMAVCGAMCSEHYLPLVGFVASVIHFATDLGYLSSFGLVFGCVCCHFRGRDDLAYKVLLAYMLLMHLPFHYLRVIPDTSIGGWLLLVVFAGASWWVRPLALLRGSTICRRVAVILIAAHTIANVMHCPSLA